MTERFMSHVSPEPNSGCWLWAGCVSKYGYGRFGYSALIWSAAKRKLAISKQ